MFSKVGKNKSRWSWLAEVQRGIKSTIQSLRIGTDACYMSQNRFGRNFSDILLNWTERGLAFYVDCTSLISARMWSTVKC